MYIGVNMLIQHMLKFWFIGVLVINLTGFVRCTYDVSGERSSRSDDSNPLEAMVTQQSQAIADLTAKLQAAESAINSLTSSLQASKGSLFTRWGRSTCPDRTTTVYSGVAGGSYNHDTGGGANRLCLSTEPAFDSIPPDTVFGRLCGAQYYLPNHHQTDVVCAVCRAPYSLTYMLPGTNSCPRGSHLQYHGHLSAGDHNNPAASEYLCLDADPEDRLGSQDIHDSAYFEHVRAHCGSLPCPPYVENKVVTCAVCSMD